MDRNRVESKTKMSTPSWVVTQALAFPESRYGWDFGVHAQGTARAKALHKLFRADGIDAQVKRDDTYKPGLWKLDFPIKDYRRAAAIADACYVGENWWPNKPKK